MRPKARANSPISSRLLGVIGWSSLPSPTTAIAWVSSRIGRVSPREMSPGGQETGRQRERDDER